MIPVVFQITFVGMDPVEAVKQEVRAWLPRLGVLVHRLTKGHARIEALEEHRRERRYQVGMELTMPEGVVVVTRVHPSNLAHEDVYVAVRNAFRAARRELEDYFKTHPGPERTEPESHDAVGEAVTVAQPPETVLSPQSDAGAFEQPPEMVLPPKRMEEIVHLVED